MKLPRFAIMAGSLLLTSALFAQTDVQFSKANQAFADGKFKEAISQYEAMVHSGEWTAALFYDLGNAYFRTSDFARAILNYERALALQPNHPEAQANLKIARDEARALELSPNWADRLGPYISVNQSTLGAAVLLWAGVFLCVAFLLTRPRRTILLTLSLCGMLAAVALAAYLTALEHGARGGLLAVVTGNDTRARLATADSATSVMALPAGSEVRIFRERGDWVYVDLPNNQRGWLPAQSIERVRL